MKGCKTGGRRPGTANKATLDVQERLAALGCDPIEGMARLAMDLANDPALRGRMFAELAGYVAPKRKAVDFVMLNEERSPPHLVVSFLKGGDKSPGTA